MLLMFVLQYLSISTCVYLCIYVYVAVLDSGNIRDIPHSLIVLLEEEVVAIDLLTNGWPPFRLPYLNR